MKKILFVLLLPVFATAQLTEGYVISGKIAGLKDSTEVTLVSAADGQQLNHTKVKNGSFVLKGKVTDPSVYYLSFQGYLAQIDFFMKNDAVSLTGDIAQPGLTVVKGGALQEDFATFKTQFVPFLQQLQALAGAINPERDQKRRDSLIQVYNGLRSNALTATVQFLRSKKTSPVSAFVLSVMAPLFNGPAEVEPFYAELQPAAQQGPFARELERNFAAAKVGSVGTQALDFTQKDVNGKPVSLSSFRGKYVLIDFWASWCRPCRAENPNVVSAYNAYKNKNFTVLGVSLDQSKPNWLEAIQSDRLTWTHVSDLQFWNNAVAQLYHVQSIPANFLIDPNGKIIGRDLRGDELNRVLKDVLK